MSGIIIQMDLGIATHQTRSYTVATPVYEGPLDLLLQLIERAELDITKLALAQVTDQFLAHMRTLQTQAAEEVSSFLIIAAKLIQIKSEVLLPRPPRREQGEEDPSEALARQLLLYRKFKRAAEHLAALEETGRRTYLRLSPPPKLETGLDMSGIGIADLIQAAQDILMKSQNEAELKTVVAPSPITIRQKINLIVSQLQLRGRTTFRSFIHSARSRLEVVVTFLAVLELIKRYYVQASQDTNFGEIEIVPSNQLAIDEDFELEFGE